MNALKHFPDQAHRPFLRKHRRAISLCFRAGSIFLLVPRTGIISIPQTHPRVECIHCQYSQYNHNTFEHKEVGFVCYQIVSN